jgi:hypothetical protein
VIAEVLYLRSIVSVYLAGEEAAPGEAAPPGRLRVPVSVALGAVGFTLWWAWSRSGVASVSK